MQERFYRRWRASMGKYSWIVWIHLKVDTRVAFHAKNADTNDPGEILLEANDADIATCQGNSSTLV